ncbi:MAG: hypothetical protein ACLFV3_10430 [Phycisphaeraceae bacterium]
MQIDADFSVPFRHRLRFTRDALLPEDATLARCLEPAGHGPARVLAFLDTHVARALPELPEHLRTYAAAHGFELVGRVQPVIGGEMCKNDRDVRCTAC